MALALLNEIGDACIFQAGRTPAHLNHAPQREPSGAIAGILSTRFFFSSNAFGHSFAGKPILLPCYGTLQFAHGHNDSDGRLSGAVRTHQ
jgi:hypothetical protein